MDGKYVLREKAKSLREFGNKVIGAEKSWDNFPEQKCMTAALGGVTHSREHGDGRPWASLPSCELDSQRRLGDTEPDFPESRPGGHGRLNSQALPQLPISLLNAADVSPGLEAKPGARGRLAGPSTLGAAAGTAGLPPDRQHLEKNKSVRNTFLLASRRSWAFPSDKKSAEETHM